MKERKPKLQVQQKPKPEQNANPKELTVKSGLEARQGKSQMLPLI